MTPMRPFFPILFLATATWAPAVVLSDATVIAIPDGSSSGVARSLTVSAPGETIVGAEVDIDISAATGGVAFLGDLYLYLSNGTDLAVLVNRAGRRSGGSAGYSDNQSMQVTFSSLGAADIHNYRLALNGSHVTPLAGPLTGLWQADGRLTDPALVLDSSPRTAGLDVFTGDAATGTWTLFAADLSLGSTHRINSWTLRLDTIPEPGCAALVASTLLLPRRRRPASAGC